MKKCSKCGVEKVVEAFYAGRYNCKECHKADVHARVEADREGHRARERQRRAENPEHYREKWRRQYTKNREKINARRNELRKENPRYLEAQRAYYRANKEHVDRVRLERVRRDKERYNEINRRWRERNPEQAKAAYKRGRQKWRAKNPDYMRRYYRENIERYELNRRRRAMRLAGVESEDYSRKEIYERDGGKCRGCQVELPLEPGGFAIDHIVPLSLDGPDTRANVQLMCPTCNRAKWANLEGQIHLPV